MISDADRALLQAELAALRQARTALLTGRAIQAAGHAGKSTAFTAADPAALDRRIREIEARLGLTPRRAIAIRF